MLRNLVQIVKKHIRQSNVVVRMGGDEFLIILRGCSPEKAEEITQKILSDFEESRFHLTFSYGVHPFTGSLNERNPCKGWWTHVQDEKGEEEGEHIKTKMAPAAGLEPATTWLTARRSTG